MSVEQFGYKQELHRALTFRDLLVYGMIFMVPIAPFGVFGYVWDGAQGMVALASYRYGGDVLYRHELLVDVARVSGFRLGMPMPSAGFIPLSAFLPAG
jgi:hypothetical protein